MGSINNNSQKLYEVLDDILPSEQLGEIQKSLNDRTMPFYWHDDIDYQNASPDILNYGLSHQLFSFKTGLYSDWLPLYAPVVHATCDRLGFEVKQVLRMRIVLTTNVGSAHTNQQHVDLPEIDCLTIVYYPEACDGDFVLCLDGRDMRIEPKENRCIVMFKNIGHHGSNPVSYRKRVAVNANVIVK